ncbi:hypothetical protein DICVIV_05357 [Dictyocaulus viviparus]|uniref:7TM GPCR serpentine receptor class x (Srx) domain-containing protein n=1 Tax=Dictyocaulus viviparus TaxID=29172 RepID=A0A0D8XXF4_DICVI|nr:hypothetical protein DICVIV_05357 [Dictyocaulus viviparus]
MESTTAHSAISQVNEVLSLVALCCERCVATIRSSKYERNSVALSVLLIALTALGVVGAIFYVYNIRDFDEQLWSFGILPPGAVEEYNYVAIMNIIISVFCIFIFYISSGINERQSTISCSTLTSRYQIRENVITTRFAARIATIQVVFFILQSAGGILVRVYGDYFFRKNGKLDTSIRHMIHMVPLFTLVLSICSLRQLKYYRSHRGDNIRSIITMESRGYVGTQNYENIVTKSWQIS